MGVDFSRIAERYDETRGGAERGVNFAAELAPHLPPGPLLEIGIGTGVVAVALRAHGRDPLGVDIAAAMLARAAERLGPRVALYDGRRLPVADSSLAGAYAVWVLHLVEDQAGLFAEVHRVLRPGGRLLVVQVNRPLEDEIDRVVRPMYVQLLGQAFGRDDCDHLAALAARAGLAVYARVPGRPHRHRVAPAEEAARIERREGAAFWDLDQERWDTIVAPAVARLKALGDQEIEREFRHELLVLERKAG